MTKSSTQTMRRFFYLALLLIFAASCVPNKKLVYLQHKDELKHLDEIKKDTVLREYELANYEYTVQPEDILFIKVKSLTDEEFDIFITDKTTSGGNQNNMVLSGYLVDKSGNIEFPEIGKVKVLGLTLHEIKELVQNLALSYLDSPTVEVRLLNFRVTILGEVNNEGTVNTFNNRTTIMESIGLAGGLGELADRHNIKIIRQASGQTSVIYVDLLDENLMDSEYFFVHQNDVIIVPPLKQRPFRRYFGQNVSLFLSSVSTLLLVISLINN
ncbi:polysaccharide biosynthesis/export family protein [Fulvivirga ligni]|uniref:polysaccharide biosynthesis/export family protein n=1 Tax=Fulvivirga ligni TaxID=2904246 RepID=UPI001F3A6503|nr:polysaccharide biosynthesis/export family protein [Fulvivirga ligni]UII23868.1 polysaccharide biosynthesis/export family protein [Fulvivirga ligni]